jgi:hypothetical protein
LNSNPIVKNEKKIDAQGIENMFINLIIHDYGVEKKKLIRFFLKVMPYLAPLSPTCLLVIH